MKKILSIENLNVGYDGQIVLRNVNLDVFENDFIGIIGPNGGGKTTLIKVITGLLKAKTGKIEYSFRKSGDDFRSAIGYLPQQSTIDKQFPISVKEVLLSGLMSTKQKLFGSYRNKDKKKAQEILERFGLSEYSTRAVGELSGGQLQRLFLARAIISSPELLILDEPDSFVDNQFEQELYPLLKELNQEMAILLVSHDIGTISSYIKTIACVNRDLHYHPSNKISSEQLKVYNCPVDIISHGRIPHRVLPEHQK